MSNMTIMSNKVKRRVEYAQLYYRNAQKNKVNLLFKDISLIISYLNNRMDSYEFNDNSSSKWHGIDEINFGTDCIEIILKNCTYQYTPNVIDINTKTEYPNSRTLSQGDKEKTHFLVKNDCIIFEKRQNGSSISVLIGFLNEALSTMDDENIERISKIEHSTIMIDDFIQLFETSTRIKNIDIVVDKSQGLDEFARFHEDDGVKETYTLKFIAKRGKTINKETIRYYIDKFFNGDGIVEKITMDIDTEDEDAMTINTERCVKHAYLNISKDSNGVIVSSEIFKEMKLL